MVSSTPEAFVSAKPAPDVYGLEPPALYQRVTWSVVPMGKQELSRPALHWFTIHPYLDKTGGIDLSGTEWSAIETINSLDEGESMNKNGSSFYDYYQNTLLKQGWKGRDILDLNLGNNGISTTGFGGVTGSRDGFLKTADGKIRVIIFQDFMTGSSSGKITYPVFWRY